MTSADQVTRHIVALIEPAEASLLAAAWATSVCEQDHVIELVAPWRGRQPELDPGTGRMVDPQTAARLRLLSAMDRIRSVEPEARLTLQLKHGTPVEVLPEITRGRDLLVLGGRAPSRWLPDHGIGRRVSLLRLSACPTVVVRPVPHSRPEAVLATLAGSRTHTADAQSLHQLVWPTPGAQ